LLSITTEQNFHRPFTLTFFTTLTRHRDPVRAFRCNIAVTVRPKKCSRKSARMDTKVDTKTQIHGHQSGHQTAMLLIVKGMAEREGFEPPVPVKARTLSRRLVSTTHPSLRVIASRHNYFNRWIVSAGVGSGGVAVQSHLGRALRFRQFMEAFSRICPPKQTPPFPAVFMLICSVRLPYCESSLTP
jgi:hypothetical protein